MKLIVYSNKYDNFFAELHDGDTKLRALHTHEGHRNPDPSRTALGGPHMHFPSVRYPLVYGRSSYAYRIDDCPDFGAVIDCLRFFCAELGIIIVA